MNTPNTRTPERLQIVIRREDPGQADVRALIHELDAYLIDLYDPDENHLLDVETLRAPDVSFLVARAAGEALGCGALRMIAGAPGEADSGEIKRMYVAPRARGLGLGKKILQALEDHARELGLQELKLETGNRQPEALGLYRTSGFEPCGSFAGYPQGVTTVFLGKRIA